MIRSGWRLAIHEELASTQDSVLAAARAGEPEGLAVLALRQSAGRGTQGRPWQSRPGNLALSCLIRPEGPARQLPQWSLLAAVALVEAAAGILPPDAPLRLKWPNDLLLEDAKCAGILTEGAPDGAGGIGWIVFGIGVNLAWSPELPDRRTTSLADHGAKATPQAFAWALLAALDRWRGVQAAEGFAPVRQAWLRHGPALGAMLALRQADGQLVQGSFAGLDDDGRLLLRNNDRMLTASAGELVA